MQSEGPPWKWTVEWMMMAGMWMERMWMSVVLVLLEHAQANADDA